MGIGDSVGVTVGVTVGVGVGVEEGHGGHPSPKHSVPVNVQLLWFKSFKEFVPGPPEITT